MTQALIFVFAWRGLGDHGDFISAIDCDGNEHFAENSFHAAVDRVEKWDAAGPVLPPGLQGFARGSVEVFPVAATEDAMGDDRECRDGTE